MHGVRRYELCVHVTGQDGRGGHSQLLLSPSVARNGGQSCGGLEGEVADSIFSLDHLPQCLHLAPDSVHAPAIHITGESGQRSLPTQEEGSGHGGPLYCGIIPPHKMDEEFLAL